MSIVTSNHYLCSKCSTSVHIIHWDTPGRPSSTTLCSMYMTCYCKWWMKGLLHQTVTRDTRRPTRSGVLCGVLCGEHHTVHIACEQAMTRWANSDRQLTQSVHRFSSPRSWSLLESLCTGKGQSHKYNNLQMFLNHYNYSCTKSTKSTLLETSAPQLSPYKQ